ADRAAAARGRDHAAGTHHDRGVDRTGAGPGQLTRPAPENKTVEPAAVAAPRLDSARTAAASVRAVIATQPLIITRAHSGRSSAAVAAGRPASGSPTAPAPNDSDRPWLRVRSIGLAMAVPRPTRNRNGRAPTVRPDVTT